MGWAAFVALLLAYPLSMPAILCMAIDHDRFEPVARFYTPIFWAMGKSQTVNVAVDWYSSFWGLGVGPPGPP